MGLFDKRSDIPKQRETVPLDPYPIEEIGSLAFLNRVERFTALLAYKSDLSGLYADLQSASTAVQFISNLQRAIYQKLNQDSVQNNRGEGSVFTKPIGNGAVDRYPLKAYLHLQDSYAGGEGQIVAAVLQQLDKLEIGVKAKHVRRATNRVEHIVFYFNKENRRVVLDTITRLCKDFTMPPGELRTIAPEAAPGINYAVEPNENWQNFLSALFPDRQSEGFSYRSVVAFFASLNLTQHVIDSYAPSSGQGRSRKVEQMQSTLNELFKYVTQNATELNVSSSEHQEKESRSLFDRRGKKR